MSDESIRAFQEVLEEDWFTFELSASASHVLWQAEVIVSEITTPLTWQFLTEVVAFLKALSPWVSDDPMHVKAREIAPHVIKELWCEQGRVEYAATEVALALEGGVVFGIYLECQMYDGRLELDSRHGLGKGTLIEHARRLCGVYAYRVLMEIADWDLTPSK